MTLAVNDELFEATVRGDAAEKIAQARAKSTVVGTGKLRVHRWKAADGTPRQQLEIVLTNVEICPPPKHV